MLLFLLSSLAVSIVQTSSKVVRDDAATLTGKSGEMEQSATKVDKRCSQITASPKECKTYEGVYDQKLQKGKTERSIAYGSKAYRYIWRTTKHWYPQTICRCRAKILQRMGSENSCTASALTCHGHGVPYTTEEVRINDQ